ncbi:diacylglycerol kinase [Chloropicon primus]|uniref:Diacylglycerol kinase n=1 Tax=Chloropicon primus TaxID=1764295 RepID=A0A5B8MZ90_9CHLO|nr:diacylglycerol kinase [Chloropicon primus]UPR03930.1 diacylglycerol kinase [Chloropicon primus]|mmetsp:Transcript_11943/g.33000  ORF Transcript_11943/g.33000 Transcript_11943/m.33000 type:complete len:494 (+) Transcript_11943:279-1760(+)|eukprot:QDZ24724.1 diacylglycerol kinase [Chloropicon primus]
MSSPGGSSFEVSRKGGVSGCLDVDVEQGRCIWRPHGSEDEAFLGSSSTTSSARGCFGCFTWEGALSLPTSIDGADLVGALACSSEGTTKHPSFRILYTTEVLAGRGRTRRRLLRTEPFVCGSTGQLEECLRQVRRVAGHSEGRKRIMVLVNPVSGKGKGLKILRKTIVPMLEASGIPFDVKCTEKAGDGKALGRGIDLEAYDTLVVSGGDGTLHEVMQGLFGREEASEKAGKVALAVLPTGSGNGFAASIDVVDAVTGLWFVLKNKRSPMDVVSVLQEAGTRGIHREFMCLSTTFGFIANLDLDTEYLRCLGQARFTLGAMYEILRGKTTEAAVAYVPKGSEAPPCDEDSSRIACLFLDGIKGMFEPSFALDDLPPPWKKMEREDFQFFVLANVPCLSMGDRVAPTVSASSGSLALVSTHKSSRLENIDLFEAVDNGTTHESPTASYKEVVAFAIDPKGGKLQFSLDGERIPVSRVYGELHKGLGTFINNYNS